RPPLPRPPGPVRRAGGEWWWCTSIRPPLAVDLLANCPNNSAAGSAAIAPAAAIVFKRSRREDCPSQMLLSVIVLSLCVRSECKLHRARNNRPDRVTNGSMDLGG